METGGTGNAAGACLIAGCGYVGARLARRMLARGPVLALARSPETAAALANAGIPARAVDLDEPLTLEIPALVSIVYLVPPAREGTGDPRFERFLAGLGGARPAVLVYLSTTGVYGDAGGLAVDEDSPTLPADDASRRRLAAENAAFVWCRAHEVRCVVLRVSGIYGPHRLPLDRLKAGEPILRPEESGPGNRIHVDDLVEVCLAALAPPETRRPVTGVVNVADGDPRSTGAFLELVAQLAKLPPPRRVTMAEARLELSPGMLAFLQATRRIRRLREDLGIRLRYADPEDGVRASLREMNL